ncbi:acylphosphatase [Alsobacter soli]|uniref:acylphosphatase n=1 Tax=Alsobacter soli TaxID=2109933 RepID=A0A2T1HMC1_9HYPH|nr:acylphosphatase [Alsobacter soli]PSC02782.1 acylphosphatase [Alsobacter soli]
MGRTVRIIVRGRVQGVGYRAWTEREALARGLQGWVRNRLDGSVEALISGDERQVEDMLRACRHGPRLAAVDDVTVQESAEPAGDAFRTAPTI